MGHRVRAGRASWRGCLARGHQARFRVDAHVAEISAGLNWRKVVMNWAAPSRSRRIRAGRCHQALRRGSRRGAPGRPRRRGRAPVGAPDAGREAEAMMMFAPFSRRATPATLCANAGVKFAWRGGLVPDFRSSSGVVRAEIKQTVRKLGTEFKFGSKSSL